MEGSWCRLLVEAGFDFLMEGSLVYDGTSPGTSSFVGILNASRALRQGGMVLHPTTLTRHSSPSIVRTAFILLFASVASLRSLSPHLCQLHPILCIRLCIRYLSSASRFTFNSSVFLSTALSPLSTTRTQSLSVIQRLHARPCSFSFNQRGTFATSNQRGTFAIRVTQINQPNQPTVGLHRRSSRVRFLFACIDSTRAGSTRAPCGTDVWKVLCDHQRPRVRHQVM
jgi:hypothetical protein